MADTIIPAVSIPASTTAVATSTQPTCSISLERLMAFSDRDAQILRDECQAIRANELARIAALNLVQVSSGTISEELSEGRYDFNFSDFQPPLFTSCGGFGPMHYNPSKWLKASGY